MASIQILSKIKELTSNEYEEEYYFGGYNGSTLTTLDPKIIHLTFSDIHYDLNEAFELIYLRGEFVFLERIKAILNIDLKTLNDLYEAGEWVPECTYEIDFEEFIEREKSFEHIYNCKTQYIQKLIDKLNEYASVSERNKVQQTIESETITQSALSSSDNIDPINDNTMDINFEAIFEIALTYAEDHAEMREFCIREQKKADRDYFYKKSTFYKGLLKVVTKEKERAKPNPNPQPATMRIGTMFIVGSGGSPYKYSSIELLEQIVSELLYEDKIPQEELANIENRVENIETQPSHVSEIASYDSINEAMPIEITTSPPSFDIPLSNDELTEHFNELVKKPNSILHHNTDFHHFCYAFSGHIIPNDKLPYKAIELIDYNKSFYNYLNDEIVQAQLKRPQKCLPNLYRKKAKELFINKNGKPLKLSNPT